MSKQTRKTSAQQQTLPFSAREASNMAAECSPLTLETLIIELEKPRKSTTVELTASLNAALAPIKSTVESIVTTVAKHFYYFEDGNSPLNPLGQHHQPGARSGGAALKAKHGDGGARYFPGCCGGLGISLKAAESKSNWAS